MSANASRGRTSGGAQNVQLRPRKAAEALRSLPELLASVALSGASLLLLVSCWRHRAILGLICATLALALAISAALGLTRAAAPMLVGSFVATVIGTVLLMLGQAVERLLDGEPRQRG
jgi:CHASE2 domain-containing sensor protein